MDLKEKVTLALADRFKTGQIQLDDDDGISGFLVSNEFRGMSSIDRQSLIYEALRSPAFKFSKAELRRILGIAALTPVEFEIVDQNRGGG
jgi:acid stress-induced BolA-like protein IbaG/YrbA